MTEQIPERNPVAHKVPSSENISSSRGVSVPSALNDARLIIATHNPHKLQELRQILEPFIPGLDPAAIISASDLELEEPIEDEITFAGNALLKARFVARSTGIPAVADDSGLCVDAMGGAPGVFSARWCGRHGDDQANLQLLLAQMEDVPDDYRSANFTCAAALVHPDGREWTLEGKMFGTLRREPVGENGFGYDPIFEPEGYSVTSAELSPEEKNKISHRAQAFDAIAPVIAEVIAGDRR